jgi:hypothetical protein
MRAQLCAAATVDDPYLDVSCELCGDPGDEAKMILCDACERGYHTYCLMPRLKRVPRGDWFCTRCKSPAAAHNVQRGPLKGTVFDEVPLTREEVLQNGSQKLAVGVKKAKGGSYGIEVVGFLDLGSGAELSEHGRPSHAQLHPGTAMAPMSIRIQAHAQGISETLCFCVSRLAAALRRAVEVRDNFRHLKVHPDTFSGKAALDELRRQAARALTAGAGGNAQSSKKGRKQRQLAARAGGSAPSGKKGRKHPQLAPRAKHVAKQRQRLGLHVALHLGKLLHNVGIFRQVTEPLHSKP